jgi:hypothetical protein
MRTTLTSALIASGFLVPFVLAAQDDRRAPATAKEVMTTMTIPASDAIFSAAAEPPASADDWAALQRNAAILGESGQLLMTDAMARDKTTWMEMARALVRESEAVRKMADARNRSALEEAADRIYVTCKSCHDRYSP